MKYKIIYYRTRRGDSPVEVFIDNLDKTVCAKVYAKLCLLEEYGLLLFKGKVEKVKGYDFYELKVSKGKKGNFRIFFLHKRLGFSCSGCIRQKISKVEKGRSEEVGGSIEKHIEVRKCRMIVLRNHSRNI